MSFDVVGENGWNLEGKLEEQKIATEFNEYDGNKMMATHSLMDNSCEGLC